MLRSFIYQSGISGHLVKQKTNVEFDEIINIFKSEGCKDSTSTKIKKWKQIFSIGETLDDINFDIPKHWVFKNLNKIATGFSYGTSTKSVLSGKISVLRMGNIQNNKLDWNKLVFTNDDIEIEKYRLVKGDVLFNRTNSNVLVGKTAVYDGKIPAIYAGYIIKVCCVETLLNPHYLNICLNSPYGKAWAWKVKADGISQSNINAQKLSQFVVPLPPLEEQKRIVAKVDQLMSLCDQLEQQHTQSYHDAERLMEATVKALVA